MITKHARERIDVENKEKIEKRRKVISEKCGQPKDLNGLSDGIYKYIHIKEVNIIIFFFLMTISHL